MHKNINLVPKATFSLSHDFIFLKTSPLLGRFLVSFNLQSAICDLQSAVCSLRSAVCGLRSAVCGLRSAVYGLRSAVCSLRSAVCSLQSAVCGLRSAVCSLQSAVCSLQIHRKSNGYKSEEKRMGGLWLFVPRPLAIYAHERNFQNGCLLDGLKI